MALTVFRWIRTRYLRITNPQRKPMHHRGLISTKWIWREIIPTSIAISWRWNCYSIQIYFRLKHHIQNNFVFTHTSFEVLQASITLQHNTLHFFCLFRPPPNRRNNLTDSMFTEQLPDLLDYVSNLPGFVCRVGDMNIHFDNTLQQPNRL